MARLSKEDRQAYERYLRVFLDAPHVRGQHAGKCYPADRDGVLGMVRAHFEKGVGALPETLVRDRDRGPLPGIVVPHLDFRVGGPVYSYGYRELLSSEPADVYVILGVGHRCPAELSVLRKGYETVLGEVPCDPAFVADLAGRVSFPIEVAPLSHHDEHSIEFAVIYLQAIAAMYPEYGGFSIVPVLCGAMHEEIMRGSADGSAFGEFAGALRATIGACGKRVCVIGSIDGSHVGPRFQHPFNVDGDVRRRIEDLDRAAFEAASKGDPGAFFSIFLDTYNAQGFDGVGVLYIMLHLFGGRATFELLHYDQWYEREDRSMVTLASGVFRRRG
ncbi:MAG TPA: AmmeMemoRadiSam system protein B [Verrucomicrobiae bacterium]|nr:AmmeMemoRadiSam system protein B [Verrucomicrobiae bacterium]